MTNKFLKIALLSTLGFVSTNAVSASDSVMTRMIGIADKAVGAEAYSHEGDKQIVAARAFVTLVNSRTAALKAAETAVEAQHVAEGRVATLETELATLRTNSERALEIARQEVNQALGELRAEIQRLQDANRALQSEVDSHKELDQLNEDARSESGDEEAARVEAERAEAARAEAERVEAERRAAAQQAIMDAQERLNEAREALIEARTAEHDLSAEATDEARAAAAAAVARAEEDCRAAEEALEALNTDENRGGEA